MRINSPTRPPHKPEETAAIDNAGLPAAAAYCIRRCSVFADSLVGESGGQSYITGNRRSCLPEGRAGFRSGRLTSASRSSVAVVAHAEADQKQRGDYAQEDKAHRHLGAHDVRTFAVEQPLERVRRWLFAGIALLERHPTRQGYYMIDNICQTHPAPPKNPVHLPVYRP